MRGCRTSAESPVDVAGTRTDADDAMKLRADGHEDRRLAMQRDAINNRVELSRDYPLPLKITEVFRVRRGQNGARYSELLRLS